MTKTGKNPQIYKLNLIELKLDLASSYTIQLANGGSILQFQDAKGMPHIYIFIFHVFMQLTAHISKSKWRM